MLFLHVSLAMATQLVVDKELNSKPIPVEKSSSKR